MLNSKVSLFVVLSFSSDIGQTLTTTISSTLPSNYNDYLNKFFYKKVGMDNEIYRCGLGRLCVINTSTYNTYENITHCEDTCSSTELCKGYIYYNSSTTLFKCNLLNRLGYNNLQGLDPRPFINTTYFTYIKKKKQCQWWCHNHKKRTGSYKVSTSWNERCHWEAHYCTGCEECRTIPDVCEDWCHTHSSKWVDK